MVYRTSVGLDVHVHSIAAMVLDHLTKEVAKRSLAYDSAAVAAWALFLEGLENASTRAGPPVSTNRGCWMMRASSVLWAL